MFTIKSVSLLLSLLRVKSCRAWTSIANKSQLWDCAILIDIEQYLTKSACGSVYSGKHMVLVKISMPQGSASVH